MELITIKNASKTYNTGVTAIHDISLSINKGEFVFITGKTGCGKSTLIKMLYREEKPTHGEIYLGGINVAKVKNNKVYKLRRKIGIVFQDYKLLPKLTVYENVDYFCSLYINNNMYSKYFSNQRRLQREGQVDPNIEISISYEINSCMASSGTDFPALISAFTYMYQLNGNRSFPIIEQIRDYRNTGSKVLMSNFDPKTEIREEFNIFANAEQPESVLTNFKPQIFMCDFNKSTNSFVITKKRG